MKKFLKYIIMFLTFLIFILWVVKIFFLTHDYQIKKYNENIEDKDFIVSFHGIYGTEKQLRFIDEALAQKGYNVVNIQYPTTEDDIKELSEKYVKPVVEEQEEKLKQINLERKKQNLSELKLNFIVHSMGSVLLRYYLKENKVENLGKVILISPPSHGSQLSDNPISYYLQYFLGKAVLDMKTDKNSFVNLLEEPYYDCYVIIGNKSNNFLYSLLIKGQDDGMVPVSTAKLENASFEIIEGTTHTSILKDERTINRILEIIR